MTTIQWIGAGAVAILAAAATYYFQKRSATPPRDGGDFTSG